MIEVTAANALDYLQRGLRVTPLGGGVSNTVLLIEGDDPPIVLKQSLAKLRVEQDWFSDRRRIWREASALTQLAALLPAGSVPRVLFEDRDNFLFAMTAAPAGCETWKDRLLRGEADPRIAGRIGSILAALIHAGRSSAALREEFADQSVFDELRLDPYYRATALRHPTLEPFFDDLIALCRERPFSLVHGDFSPKNFLIFEDRVIAIDWEVIHTGDPAFDAAFLTNHLLLKAFHRPEFHPLYAAAARAFWSALRAGLPPDTPAEFEISAMKHLAGLMLARVDGKSPVEYLDPAARAAVRRFALAIIAEPPRTVEEIFERQFHAVHSAQPQST